MLTLWYSYLDKAESVSPGHLPRKESTPWSVQNVGLCSTLLSSERSRISVQTRHMPP